MWLAPQIISIFKISALNNVHIEWLRTHCYKWKSGIDLIDSIELKILENLFFSKIRSLDQKLDIKRI